MTNVTSRFRPVPALSGRLFKQKRGRHLIAVLTIFLTAMMFTALCTLTGSMAENLTQMAFRQTGSDAEASIRGLTEEEADRIASHPDVEAVGKHSVRYSVLFDAPTEANVAPAFTVPFSSDRARPNPPLAKKLPPFASLFSLQGENVLLTSLRRIGNAVYLRLVETRGVQQDISFPKSVFKSCESILLSGQKQRDVLPQNNEFRYTMKPFEIVTFRLVVSSLA